MEILRQILAPFSEYYAWLANVLSQNLQGALGWFLTPAILTLQWLSTHIVISIIAGIFYEIFLRLDCRLEKGEAKRARGLLLEDIKNDVRSSLRINYAISLLRSVSFRLRGLTAVPGKKNSVKLPRVKSTSSKHRFRPGRLLASFSFSRGIINFVVTVPIVLVGLLRAYLSATFVNVLVWTLVLTATYPKWLQRLINWITDRLQGSGSFFAQVTPAVVVASGTLLAILIATASLSDLRGAVEYHKQVSVSVRKSLARMAVFAKKASEDIYKFEEKAFSEFTNYILDEYVKQVTSDGMWISNSGTINIRVSRTSSVRNFSRPTQDRWKKLREHEASIEKSLKSFQEELELVESNGDFFTLYRACPRRCRNLLKNNARQPRIYSQLGASDNYGLPQLLRISLQVDTSFSIGTTKSGNAYQFSDQDKICVAKDAQSLIDDFADRLIRVIKLEFHLQQFSVLVRRTGRNPFYKRFISQISK